MGRTAEALPQLKDVRIRLDQDVVDDLDAMVAAINAHRARDEQTDRTALLAAAVDAWVIGKWREVDRDFTAWAATVIDGQLVRDALIEPSRRIAKARGSRPQRPGS